MNHLKIRIPPQIFSGGIRINRSRSDLKKKCLRDFHLSGIFHGFSHARITVFYFS